MIQGLKDSKKLLIYYCCPLSAKRIWKKKIMIIFWYAHVFDFQPKL
jgi:hypothetical protein